MNAHDERISSFLDDAMPAGERSAFESELLDNAELRQQVIELRQLRQDVALLPRYSVTEGFAQRVVAAAVSAKANENANITLASNPSNKTVRRATIGVLAVAASLLIMVGTVAWNYNNQPSVAVVPKNPALAPVLASLPGEEQVLVVRITSPKDVAAGTMLRDALAEQGIEKRQPSDKTTGGGMVRNAYRQTVEAAGGPTARAADALYLQISPAELELALARLATPGSEVKLVPEQLLAVAEAAPLQKIGTNLPGAEEVPGNPVIAAEPGKKPEFVQELSPGLFQLPKEVHPAPASLGATPKGKVRVLILIEQAK